MNGNICWAGGAYDRRQAIFAGLLCAAGGAARAAPAGAELPNRYFSNLEVFGFTGAAFVSEGERSVYRTSRGYADRSVGDQFDFETPFNIASLTKTFTALCILKLAEDGRLSTLDPLSRWLPASGDHGEVTLAQLLAHVGGMRRDSLRSDGSYTIETAIKEILSKPPVAKPGTEAHYSNDGYKLLAAVVEAASGVSYREAVKRAIFKPARMDRSGFVQDYSPHRPVAHGYNEWSDFGTFASTPQPGWNDGAGNIVSTASDVERFVRALSEDRIVRPATFADMCTRKSGDGDERNGFGWRLSRDEQGREYGGHGGDNPGYHTELRRYASSGRWVFVVTTQELYDESGNGLGVHKRRIAGDLETLASGGSARMPPDATAIGSRSLAGRFVGAGGSELRLWRTDGRSPNLTVAAVGRTAADALTNPAVPQKAQLDWADDTSEKLVRAAAIGDKNAIKASLGNLSFLMDGVIRDFSEWAGKLGPLAAIGPPTSRKYPFGADAVRTHFEVRFQRGVQDVQFTWTKRELNETLTGTGSPSSVILPVAQSSPDRLIAYDIVLGKAVDIFPHAGGLRVGTDVFIRQDG